MYQLRLICVGKVKQGPYLDLQNEYLKRMRPKADIVEIDGKNLSNDDANKKILEHTDTKHPVIVLDERGQDIDSLTFESTIQKLLLSKPHPIQVIIGPADGLSHEIRQLADKIICFGRMTWPHILIRIMALEQLYRVQTIASGHPYHRSN